MYFCRSKWAWIGLNDREQEGRYVWVHNNQLVAYTKLYTGEPNNSYNEDCTLLYHETGRRGRWNYAQCNRAFNYICKA